MKSKALVILSGGQDSTTCLHWALKNFDEVHTITFDYGQKHVIELQSASTVAGMSGINPYHFNVVRIPNVLRGRSPLTNAAEPLELYDNFEQMEDVIKDRTELTFVPMRNALFMVLAANYAICNNIRDLVTGVCQEDNANYPDCREVYVQSMQQTISLALGLDKENMGKMFQIHTPLMHLSKAETVLLAKELGPLAWESLAHTHTAYDGKYPPTGKDHASTLRAHGFEEAGLPDPLVLRAWTEGLMELPNTANYDTSRDLEKKHGN